MELIELYLEKQAFMKYKKSISINSDSHGSS